VVKSRSHIWRKSFTLTHIYVSVTWPPHICDLTNSVSVNPHSHIWHPHPHVWHEFFTLTYMWVWLDSVTCVTWLTQIYDTSSETTRVCACACVGVCGYGCECVGMLREVRNCFQDFLDAYLSTWPLTNFFRRIFFWNYVGKNLINVHWLIWKSWKQSWTSLICGFVGMFLHTHKITFLSHTLKKINTRTHITPLLRPRSQLCMRIYASLCMRICMCIWIYKYMCIRM